MRVVAPASAAPRKGLAVAFALVAIAAEASASAQGGACSARSAAQIVPLVELYTSEGCSSCPPADRWLSTTFARSAPRSVGIALAFHVDYWDRLGWKDRFASPAFTERQYEGMRANRARFVYTPQVVVQGRDFPEWQHPRGVSALAAAGEKPARAQITLAAEQERGSLVVKMAARIPAPADRKGAVLYVALADDGLASDVKTGENAGKRLAHDNVVRLFRAGPSPDANGEMRWEVTLPVPAETGSASTLVAFVQNAAAGDVLQAVALPLDAACASKR